MSSGEEAHPDRQTTDEKKGPGFSFALGVRYSHGRGDTLGLAVPTGYDSALVRNCGVPETADNCTPIFTKVHEIRINLGAMVAL